MCDQDKKGHSGLTCHSLTVKDERGDLREREKKAQLYGTHNLFVAGTVIIISVKKGEMHYQF